MYYYIKIGLLFSLLLAMASCRDKEDDYTAYFGGDVSNPRVPYVVLSKDNKVIDTIPLDKDNRFFVKFDSLTPGLYTFTHTPDYQYVYFEKNDSLMVSINTADFDESIVFSGRGDRKNNFMAELNAMHDKDRNQGYEIYDYDLPEFIKTIDSLHAERLAFYNRNKEAIKWSEGFDFYAKNRVDLNYYTKKEYYPYVHTRRTGVPVQPKLSKSYYDFREMVNVNDQRLTNFSPFVKYLTARLNNMAITRAQSTGNMQENALHDNIVKLTIADSMFTDQEIRNEVLNNIAFAYMLEDQNIVNNEKFLDEYMKLSTDRTEDNKIRKMGEAIKTLKTGSRLPAIHLVDSSNKPFDIGRTMEAETVIFFWTACARARLEQVYEKVEDLKEAYPEVSFIAVNVDEDSEWKKMMAKHDFDEAVQLRATDFDALRDKWVITKINRTIVLNPDGTIKNAFTNLMDDKFTDNL